MKCPKCEKELELIDESVYGFVYICNDHDRPIMIIELKVKM